MTEVRRSEIASNIKNTLEIVQRENHNARLVAVSKYKPQEEIMFAYEAGQRHFGENYVKELVEKSKNLPSDIQWHFIGNLQSNKCKIIAEIPNLYAVETIDSEATAIKLNNACDAMQRMNPLRVFVQVNTSAEDGKGGIMPDDCAKMCKHITDTCPKLKLCGLMTIGKFGRDPEAENPDFTCLVECKKKVEQELGSELNLELSMGMSEDFVQALRAGSTNVRVGRTIFGERPVKTT